MLIWFWSLLTILGCIAGVRHLARTRSASRFNGPPRVDDEALRQILETGSLESDEDEPLDMEAAARAEEDFWNESWDEPEEYSR
jgi:hypothetical protein